MKEITKKNWLMMIGGIILAGLFLWLGLYALKELPINISTKVKPGIYLKIEATLDDPNDLEHPAVWCTILQNRGAEDLGNVHRTIYDGNNLYLSGDIFNNITACEPLYIRITNLTAKSDVTGTLATAGPALNAYFSDKNGVASYPSYGVENINFASSNTVDGGTKTFIVVPNTVMLNNQFTFYLHVSLTDYVSTEYNVTQTLVNVDSSNNFNSKAIAGRDFETTLTAQQNNKLVALTEIKVSGVALTPNTHYSFDSKTGKLVVYGSAVTGPITFSARQKPDMVSVEFNDVCNCSGSVKYLNTTYVSGSSFNADTSDNLVTSIISAVPCGVEVLIDGVRCTSFEYNLTNKTLFINKEVLNGDVEINLDYNCQLVVNVYNGTVEDGTLASTQTFANYAGMFNMSIGEGATYTFARTTNYSLPLNQSTLSSAINGTYTNLTYTPASLFSTATLSLRPTSANLTLNIEQNPWRYGTYQATGTATDTATIWAGYNYVLFANNATDTAANRWIVIGESEAVWANGATNGLLPSTAPALLNNSNSIEIIHSTTTFSVNGMLYEENARTPGIKARTRMFQELTNNQVLLLKEGSINVVEAFDITTTDTVKNNWALSGHRHYLNETYYGSTFGTAFNNYIQTKSIYTAYTTSGVGLGSDNDIYKCRRLTSSQDKIFTMATLSSWAIIRSASENYHILAENSGETPYGANGSGLGELDDGVVLPSAWENSGRDYSSVSSTAKEVFIMQNFNIELYLGSYKVVYNKSSTEMNKKMFNVTSGHSTKYNSLRTGNPILYDKTIYTDIAGCLSSNGSTESANLSTRPAFVLNLG